MIALGPTTQRHTNTHTCNNPFHINITCTIIYLSLQNALQLCQCDLNFKNEKLKASI